MSDSLIKSVSSSIFEKCDEESTLAGGRQDIYAGVPKLREYSLGFFNCTPIVVKNSKTGAIEQDRTRPRVFYHQFMAEADPRIQTLLTILMALADGQKVTVEGRPFEELKFETAPGGVKPPNTVKTGIPMVSSWFLNTRTGRNQRSTIQPPTEISFYGSDAATNPKTGELIRRVGWVDLMVRAGVLDKSALEQSPIVKRRVQRDRLQAAMQGLNQSQPTDEAVSPEDAFADNET